MVDVLEQKGNILLLILFLIIFGVYI